MIIAQMLLSNCGGPGRFLLQCQNITAVGNMEGTESCRVWTAMAAMETTASFLETGPHHQPWSRQLLPPGNSGKVLGDNLFTHAISLRGLERMDACFIQINCCLAAFSGSSVGAAPDSWIALRSNWLQKKGMDVCFVERNCCLGSSVGTSAGTWIALKTSKLLTVGCVNVIDVYIYNMI